MSARDQFEDHGLPRFLTYAAVLSVAVASVPDEHADAASTRASSGSVTSAMRLVPERVEGLMVDLPVHGGWSMAPPCARRLCGAGASPVGGLCVAQPAAGLARTRRGGSVDVAGPATIGRSCNDSVPPFREAEP